MRSISKSRVALSVVVSVLGLGSVYAAPQTICVFDPAGASGDSYGLMQDFQLVSQKWGANVTLKALKEESEAVQSFKAGQCVGMFVTDLSARPFNQFVGTLNAVGAVPNYTVAKQAYHVLVNPKLKAEMTEGSYALAGAVPLGLVYFFSHDRPVTSLKEMAGKSVGVLASDQLQARLIKRIGAKAVPLTGGNFNGLFNAGNLDMIPAPAMAYRPLELGVGMGPYGAVTRFPLILLSQALIIDRTKFSTEFAAQSRDWMLGQLPRMLKLAHQAEADIPANRWVDISADDQLGYQRIMREMRMNLVKDGTYNNKMARILKRLRCQQQSSGFDCAMPDE